MTGSCAVVAMTTTIIIIIIIIILVVATICTLLALTYDHFILGATILKSSSWLILPFSSIFVLLLLVFLLLPLPRIFQVVQRIRRGWLFDIDTVVLMRIGREGWVGLVWCAAVWYVVCSIVRFGA